MYWAPNRVVKSELYQVYDRHNASSIRAPRNRATFCTTSYYLGFRTWRLHHGFLHRLTRREIQILKVGPGTLSQTLFFSLHRLPHSLSLRILLVLPLAPPKWLRTNCPCSLSINITYGWLYSSPWGRSRRRTVWL